MAAVSSAWRAACSASGWRRRPALHDAELPELRDRVLLVGVEEAAGDGPRVGQELVGDRLDRAAACRARRRPSSDFSHRPAFFDATSSTPSPNAAPQHLEGRLVEGADPELVREDVDHRDLVLELGLAKVPDLLDLGDVPVLDRLRDQLLVGSARRWHGHRAARRATTRRGCRPGAGARSASAAGSARHRSQGPAARSPGSRPTASAPSPPDSGALAVFSRAVSGATSRFWAACSGMRVDRAALRTHHAECAEARAGLQRPAGRRKGRSGCAIGHPLCTGPRPPSGARAPSQAPPQIRPSPDRVGDGVRAVAQLEAAGDVVDDVLDGPLGVEEVLAHLDRVEPVGEQPQDAHLAIGQTCERQPARMQHLALQPADLGQQAAEKVRRQASLPGRRRRGSPPSGWPGSPRSGA